MAASDRPDTLTDPVLVAPRHSQPVDAATLALEWEPVELAESYVVQVAQDTSFEHIVVEERVQDTTFSVAGRFPDDRSEFFWRVMSERAGELSSGEHVESFISMTAADVERAPETNAMEEKEDLGPYPELLKAAGQEAKMEAKGGGTAKDMAEAEAMGVEPEGIESAQILGIAISILVAVVVAAFVLFMWTDRVSERASLDSIRVSGYPDLRQTEIDAARQLTQYQVLNDAERIYQIPIDQAMRLMVNESVEDSLGRVTSTELPGLYR
jgi:hypothetical protein